MEQEKKHDKRIVRAANWLIIKELVKCSKTKGDDIKEVLCDRFDISNSFYYNMQNLYSNEGRIVEELHKKTKISMDVFLGEFFLNIGIEYEKFEKYYGKKKEKEKIEENIKKTKREKTDEERELEKEIRKEQAEIREEVRNFHKEKEETGWKAKDMEGKLYPAWYFATKGESYDKDDVAQIMDRIEMELRGLRWEKLRELSEETLQSYCDKLNKYKERIYAVKVFKEMNNK